MIKTLLVLTFSLFAANLLFSQNYRTLQFVDIVQNKPIYGVMVFTDGDFASVSDDNGNCQIDGNINEIYCKYLGYKDTLVDIKDCNQCVIKLETNYNLLEEIEVYAKYDAKKHLLKLLKESQQTAYKLDTVIYYKFKEINTISELGQTEIFTGILRADNKGYSKTILVFVSEIFNYYNSIEPETYNLMKTRLISTTFNSDVLFPRMIKILKKNTNVNRTDFSSKDSISFLLSGKKETSIGESKCISFIGNKIKTREIGRTEKDSVSNLISKIYRKYYYKIDYTLFPISIPEYVVSSIEYILENNLIVTNYVELQKIDNPDLEQELNVYFWSSNNKVVESVKIKFPGIVIPAELKEE